VGVVGHHSRVPCGLVAVRIKLCAAHNQLATGYRDTDTDSANGDAGCVSDNP